jgi:hypothetical protein
MWLLRRSKHRERSGLGGPGGHSIAFLFERESEEPNDPGEGNIYMLGQPGLGGPGGSTRSWERHPRGEGEWSGPWQHGRWGSERVYGGSWSD